MNPLLYRLPARPGATPQNLYVEQDLVYHFKTKNQILDIFDFYTYNNPTHDKSNKKGVIANVDRKISYSSGFALQGSLQ